jgi:hypothetical protein
LERKDFKKNMKTLKECNAEKYAQIESLQRKLTEMELRKRKELKRISCILRNLEN